MYKETTDFIGKDPMQWWIGQVTDPKKGKWDNLLEKKNAENGEPIYSHRCRVRIVGYHGCGDELPDDELMSNCGWVLDKAHDDLDNFQLGLTRKIINKAAARAAKDMWS